MTGVQTCALRSISCEACVDAGVDDRNELHSHLYETGNVYFDLQSRGDRYGKLVGVAPAPVGETGGSSLSLPWGSGDKAQTLPCSMGVRTPALSDVVMLPDVDHTRVFDLVGFFGIERPRRVESSRST